MICEKCLHKDVCSLKSGKRNSQFCEHYKDANEWLKIPCIAMIEQFIGEKASSAHDARHITARQQLYTAETIMTVF